MALQEIEVAARLGKDGNPQTVKFSLGQTVAEVVKQFGEEVSYSQLKGAIVVSLQAFMRSKMSAEKPLNGKALQDAVTAWKPGTRTPGKPPAEKIKEAFGKLSDAERKELLKALRG